METTQQRQVFPPVNEDFAALQHEAAALTYKYALPLAAQAFVFAFVRLRDEVKRLNENKDARIYLLEQRVAALEKRTK